LHSRARASISILLFYLFSCWPLSCKLSDPMIIIRNAKDKVKQKTASRKAFRNRRNIGRDRRQSAPR
jgi:hypothetical protein